MKDVLSRATALQQLMRSEATASSSSLVESVIDCSDGLGVAGEPMLALELLDCLLQRFGGLDEHQALRVALVRSRSLYRAGQHVESLGMARLALTEHVQCLRTCQTESYQLRILEAANLWRLDRAQEAADYLQAIRRELLGRPDSSLLASCALHLQAAYVLLGEYKLARQYGMEAIVSARRSDDRYVEAAALDNQGRLDRYLCRWGTSREATEEALHAFTQMGNRFDANNSRRSLGIALWKQGKTEEALAVGARCLEEAVQVGHAQLQKLSRLLLGMIHLHRGRIELAEGVVRTQESDKGSDGTSRATLLRHELDGDCRLEVGIAADALASFDVCWRAALAIAPKGDIAAELRRRRAECYYLLGRHEEAHTEALAGLEHCRELGDRYEEAATYRVLALSAAVCRGPDEAKKWFDQGFAYYDDIETPYEWGKLWMAYGDWLLGANAGAHADRKGALEAYYAARDHFERMGAEGKLREVSSRLDALIEQDKERAGASRAPLADVRHTPRRPRRSTELERRSAWAFETFGIVTANKALLALLDDVAKLAPSQTPMLVLGESGTGKELVARGIHALSGRKGPFMAINAGSLPREIIESELFGHVTGAFTGATRDKAGMFEVCDRGTAFLDEIAEMSVELQSRLLRYLETGELRRVGANANIAIDTRIIAATNRERGALERGDGFRLDLYYRLAHAVIALPPLRHRGDDVELLAIHFLGEACTAARRHVDLSAAALRRIRSYSWPGNVRQLRAVMKRVVLLASDGHQVTPEELQLENAEVPTTLIEELEQAERRRVGEALTQSRGSRTEAAKLLGMPRTTLINKMRRYGLS